MSNSHLFTARARFSDDFEENFSVFTAVGYWFRPFIHAANQVHFKDGKQE
jgi:hypothetical protein